MAKTYEQNTKDSYALTTKDLSISTESLDTTALVDLIPDDKINGKYTKEQKARAVAFYFAHRSLRKVESLTGIPRPTIALWKNNSEWWGILWTIFNAQKNDELDGALTDIIDKSVVEMRDRLENGDQKLTKDGELVRVAVPFRDLAVAGLGVTFDKRALGRGEATSRTEHISEGDRLKRLEAQFKRISRQEKVVEGVLLTKE